MIDTIVFVSLKIPTNSELYRDAIANKSNLLVMPEKYQQCMLILIVA